MCDLKAVVRWRLVCPLSLVFLSTARSSRFPAWPLLSLSLSCLPCRPPLPRTRPPRGPAANLSIGPVSHRPTLFPSSQHLNLGQQVDASKHEALLAGLRRYARAGSSSGPIVSPLCPPTCAAHTPAASAFVLQPAKVPRAQPLRQRARLAVWRDAAGLPQPPH